MSEKSAEVVPGLIAKLGSSGRRIYDVAAKQALAELCVASGYL